MALDYMELLESAKKELISLQQLRNDIELQKAEVDAKILGLSRTIIALAPVTGPEEERKWLAFLGEIGTVPAEVGITEMIRTAIKGAESPLGAQEVKTKLEAKGWDFSRYSNALSTIHTILKRLHEAGELREYPASGGGKKYDWLKK
jgi:hypothetical protein